MQSRRRRTLLKLIQNPVLAYTPCRRLPTGMLGFDLACGVNEGVAGLPRGLFVEMWGDTGTGKSTLALKAAAHASQVGQVIYYDVEHKIDHTWARNLGAKVGENFILSQPEDAAQCLNEIINVLDRNEELGVVLIVLDSIGGLNVMGRQYEGKEKTTRADFRDTPMARLARLLTPFFEVARPTLARSGAAFLMLNHVRASIGGYGGGQYAPGGYAKDLATALEIRTLAPTDTKKKINGQERLVGRIHEAKTRKNQTAFHPRDIRVPIRYEPRVTLDESLDVYWCGVNAGVIVDEDGQTPGGQKMAYFGETALGGGQSRSADFLDQHPDIRDAIRQQILTGVPHAQPEG